jgi:predicted nucleic acid-binding protein
MKVHFDTSFFLRHLLRQQSDIVRPVFDKTIADLGFVPISSLAKFEVVQSLRLAVWLNQNDRTKGIPATLAEDAINVFIADMGTTLRLIFPAWEHVFQSAEGMSRATKEKGHRSIDILQIAAALTTGAEVFYSFDRNQNELANAQGLKTPLLKS